MRPIPLFGSSLKSLSASVSAQRRVNCFYDIRQDEDKTKIVLRGTPGAFAAASVPDQPIRGWRVVGDYLYVVAGSSVFKVASDLTSVLLGTISNSGQYVDVDDNSIKLTLVDGVQGYYLDLPSGAPTLITDVNFPNGCRTICTLDSRSIAGTPNSRIFYVSEQLDSSVWSPAIFSAKENTSDNLIAVDVLNGALVLWGVQSIEFWQDVGAAPNPYQRINGASQTWGLAAIWSRAALNNTMIFLGQNPQGGVQVLMLHGYVPTRVSNSDLENIITGFSVYSDAVALTYMIDGHPMYQLTFPSAGRSFLFDASTGFWFETQTGVTDYTRHFGNLGVVYNTKNYISDSTTGTIYQLRNNQYTDNGTAIKRIATSRHVRLDGNEFGVSELVLEMDTGSTLLSVGQGSDPQLMLKVSRDNGKTFGPERWASIGKIGEYQRRVIWSQLGSARDFVFQFSLTDPVPFTVNLAEATISPGPEASQ